MEYNSELLRERVARGCASISVDDLELRPLSGPGEYRITALSAVDDTNDVTSVTFYVRRGSTYHNYKRVFPTAAAQVCEGPYTLHASPGDVIGCRFVGATLLDALSVFVEMVRYPVGEMPT